MTSPIDDFVIRFANVNGSGSASANSLVAKSIFRMGAAIGPKNMFPSNIQGFPTWYEIRISQSAYTGRRGGVDLMVAMNPQTFTRDEADVNPGGYLIYDKARFQSKAQKSRDDITYLPLALTQMSRDFTPSKARALLKNIVYVGALVEWLNLDAAVVETLIQEQYGHNEKLLSANRQALELGRGAVKEEYPNLSKLPFTITRNARPEEQILMTGNQACALGCLYAGATVASWYPITPSTSLVEAFDGYCQQFRRRQDGTLAAAIIQAEDEIAAIGMVLGATWMGSRAFTATSGPGISLMSEFIGYAYYAELPAVVFDVQRVGPSTGMPTRTQQSDLLSCALASHGDTKHLILMPGTIEECFSLSVQAFDLADHFAAPVFVLTDIELGMNEFMSSPLDWDDAYRPQRHKILSAEQLEAASSYFRYTDVDGDATPYRTLPATHPTKGAGLTRGSGHDALGRYTEDGQLYQDNVERLARKYETARQQIPAGIQRCRQGQVGLVYMGIIWEAVEEALDELERTQGIQIDSLRVRGFPFANDTIEFINKHSQILVVDQNRDGQLRQLLILDLELPPRDLISIRTFDGLPPTAANLCEKISQALQHQKDNQ